VTVTFPNYLSLHPIEKPLSPLKFRYKTILDLGYCNSVGELDLLPLVPQLQQLLTILNSFCWLALPQVKRHVWRDSGYMVFSVKSLYQSLQTETVFCTFSTLFWPTPACLKLVCLQRQTMEQPYSCCHFCPFCLETMDHIFLNCQFP